MNCGAARLRQPQPAMGIAKARKSFRRQTAGTRFRRAAIRLTRTPPSRNRPAAPRSHFQSCAKKFLKVLPLLRFLLILHARLSASRAPATPSPYSNRVSRLPVKSSAPLRFLRSSARRNTASRRFAPVAHRARKVHSSASSSATMSAPCFCDIATGSSASSTSTRRFAPRFCAPRERA